MVGKKSKSPSTNPHRRPDQGGPTAADLRAHVFEDRIKAGDWRGEKMDDDGGYEGVSVFTGPNARQEAVRYAAEKYDGDIEIVRHLPYPAPPRRRPRQRPG